MSRRQEVGAGGVWVVDRTYCVPQEVGVEERPMSVRTRKWFQALAEKESLDGFQKSTLFLFLKCIWVSLAWTRD